MTLRDLAAQDRVNMLADPMGMGEDVRYRPVSGDSVTIKGVWLESPNDARQDFGIGVQAMFSGATLDVAAADVPGLTRAARFMRVATGVEWEIDEMDLTTGVGWHLRLKRAGTESPKGLR